MRGRLICEYIRYIQCDGWSYMCLSVCLSVCVDKSGASVGQWYIQYDGWSSMSRHRPHWVASCTCQVDVTESSLHPRRWPDATCQTSEEHFVLSLCHCSILLCWVGHLINYTVLNWNIPFFLLQVCVFYTPTMVVDGFMFYSWFIYLFIYFTMRSPSSLEWSPWNFATWSVSACTL